MSKCRIGVVGWYDNVNCGDESYKISFPTLFPHYSFTFSNKPPPSSDVDCYVLGGGDVVAPVFVNPLIASGKPCHALSVTVSQVLDLTGFKTVCVRDGRSIQTAKSGGINPIYAPDFAFALQPDAKRGHQLVKSLFKRFELYEKLVIVVLNGHLLPDGEQPAWKTYNSENLFRCITHVADRTNASFLFLPFGLHPIFSDDRVANGWVAAKCRHWRKNATVFHDMPVQDTIDIIASADAVISTRLHSSIFSCVAGTPFIDVTHNHKNQWMLEKLGLEHLSLQYAGIGANSLLEKLNYLLKGPESFKQELNDITAREREILEGFTQSFRFL